jgi:hypothetical protein
MTPLVIGLAAVVMVILIAAAVGMRYVRNEERADLADRELDGGRTDGERDRPGGRPDPDWRRTGQPPGPQRPSARAQDSVRQRRASARGYDERPGRGELARPQQPTEALPQLRARQPRGRRNDDGDWPSTEWDKLSDADYWKEVASDKPLTTTARTAQPAQAPRPVPTAQARDAAVNAGHAPSGGPGSRRGPELRRGREARRRQDAAHGQDPRRDAARPPGRSALEPAAAGGGHDFLTAPPAARYPEPIRPEPALPGRGRAEPARPRPDRPGMTSPGMTSPGGGPAGQRAAAPMPYDDDPLTSPSFPKIVTSDSRSYGNGRPSAPTGRPSEHAVRPAEQADYSAPTAQFASYGSAGGRTADGYGRGFADSSATTAPHSYGSAAGSAAQPPAASYTANGHVNGHHSAGYATGAGHGSLAGPQPPARPPAARPLPAVPPPAGNPYGSYVSTELPGYADSPTAAYSRDQATRAYPGYPAGPANGHAGPAYSYDLPLSDSAPDLPLGDSAPPLGQSSSWYPEVPPAVAPVPSPGGPAPLPHPDRYPYAGVSGHDNGNGQRSPSGYAPGPYADGYYDVPGYPPGGYGTPPPAPVYPPVGADSGRQPDAAGYLPPEFYGGDGYGGQRR